MSSINERTVIHVTTRQGNGIVIRRIGSRCYVRLTSGRKVWIHAADFLATW